MDINQVYIDIVNKIDPENVLKNEMMKNHTSFKIGGPADLLILPKSVDEVVFAVEYCREKKIGYHIIGNGSNLLINDKGIRGVVIKIADNFKDVIFERNNIKAQAGVLLSNLSKTVMNKSLEG